MGAIVLMQAVCIRDVLDMDMHTDLRSNCKVGQDIVPAFCNPDSLVGELGALQKAHRCVRTTDASVQP